MTRRRILITGGAGFIGSHLADDLLAHGHDVRVFDSLEPQVHGPERNLPDYLHPDIDFRPGRIEDREAVCRALEGIDTVFHLAAAVGVGQSMYEIDRYTQVNNLGTAVLLQCLTENPVERLVVASSMSVYGEGLYTDATGQPVAPKTRPVSQFRDGQWELVDGAGHLIVPQATPETKPTDPASVYALGKLDQERLCLMIGEAYGIPTTALRFFNAYGPRQALSNPYTGVLAIFASRYLNGRRPQIFEDGRQQRDFVHVRDVARCCRLCLERPEAYGEVFNVGSGQPITIRDLAERLAHILERDYLGHDVTGQYRVGDIRHCYADISKARTLLGYSPQIPLEEGLLDLAEWLEGELAVDSTESARAELAQRGLTR